LKDGTVHTEHDALEPDPPQTYSPVVDWKWLLAAGVALVAICMVALVAIFAIWRADQHEENKTLRATVTAQQAQMGRLQVQIDQFSDVYNCRTKLGLLVASAQADWQIAVGDAVFVAPGVDRTPFAAAAVTANNALRQARALRAAYEDNTDVPCPV
jgi:hypothetical protein